ncbi:hypothetical protein N665_0370s0009 [Sinapis alba]|nr:hypothetical protein N665_0370s0009 [Sinapis alba]
MNFRREACEDPPSIKATWLFSLISFTLSLTLSCSIKHRIPLSISSAVINSDSSAILSARKEFRTSTATPSSSTNSNAFICCSA